MCLQIVLGVLKSDSYFIAFFVKIMHNSISGYELWGELGIMADNTWLSFVQMSDIHFRSFSGDPYDIDKPLRNAMIIDLENNALKYVGNIKGILVCGDLAFSGQKREFEIAREFLRQITDKVRLSLKDVFCVVGNHDVNQKVIKDSYIIEILHNEIKKMDDRDADNLDNILRKIQKDAHVQGLLYAPIDNYNQFADSLLCNYTVDKPNWERDFMLNEKYILRLWGMNSTVISSHKDHQNDKGKRLSDNEERKMVINNKQIPAPQDNVIYMTLCHHPTQCWNNQQLVSMMDGRVKLQLYGHKHIQSIDSDNQRIKINSGALQPERGDDWIPLYNWISLMVKENELIVRIFPRIYENNTGKFQRDGKSCDSGKEYKELKLELDELSEKQDCEEKKHVRKITLLSKEIAYRYSVLSESDLKNIVQKFPDINYDEGTLDMLLAQLQEKDIEEEFLEQLRNLE